jgi:hypothetical protein
MGRSAPKSPHVGVLARLSGQKMMIGDLARILGARRAGQAG